jgi:hypothetical protein
MRNKKTKTKVWSTRDIAIDFHRESPDALNGDEKWFRQGELETLYEERKATFFYRLVQAHEWKPEIIDMVRYHFEECFKHFEKKFFGVASLAPDGEKKKVKK